MTSILAFGWMCRRCLQPMRQSRWGDWFEHLSDSACECQHADWVDNR